MFLGLLLLLRKLCLLVGRSWVSHFLLLAFKIFLLILILRILWLVQSFFDLVTWWMVRPWFQGHISVVLLLELIGKFTRILGRGWSNTTVRLCILLEVLFLWFRHRLCSGLPLLCLFRSTELSLVFLLQGLGSSLWWLLLRHLILQWSWLVYVPVWSGSWF